MKDTPSEKDTKRDETDEPEGVHRHDEHRRHGYRGYPNNPDVGGAIHHGTGLGGVGSTEGSGTGTSGSVFTDKTREDVEEDDDRDR
jgi:hypothetical protein